MTTGLKTISIRRQLYQRAVLDSFIKLNPRWMVRNPVMFVVEVGSLLTTALWIQALVGKGEAPAGFIGGVALWLWFTSSLPTSLKRWRKGAVKPRPRRFARPARRPRLRNFTLQTIRLNTNWSLRLLFTRMTCSGRRPATPCQWMDRSRRHRFGGRERSDR